MRTPDKIKKGLECCGQVGRCMHGCPYYISHNVPSCTLHKSRDALALIQQLEEQVPRWISVEERLPEEGVRSVCLIYADGYTCVAEWSHDRRGDDWWFYVSGEYDPEVTHWMPLPQPPKGE